MNKYFYASKTLLKKKLKILLKKKLKTLLKKKLKTLLKKKLKKHYWKYEFKTINEVVKN